MRWYEEVIAVHAAVTDAVSHGCRLKSDRYFVWQEEGAADFEADDRHAEKAMTGSTDLFTKMEFDPWKDKFEAALNNSRLCWSLNSVQFEEDTGFWHYEWLWGIRYG